jgi:hypothetical protein
LRVASPLRAALLIAAAIAAICPCRAAFAQESIAITEETAPPTASPAAGGCGCNAVQQPPWHGNVHGQPCVPSCGQHLHGTVFHADPRQQLHLRRFARENCMTLPPCFPRLHGLLCEGSMPTPVPPSLPRCQQCGAGVEGGF